MEEPQSPSSGSSTGWRPPGWRRSLQLGLATVWLLDGVLQLQPMMFGNGPGGLSAMMEGSAAGNPAPVASTLHSAAAMVAHHGAAANTVVALVQIAIGLGIAWRPAVRPALVASVGWSLVVWWFGEGLGGVLHGAGSVVAGGPGPAVLYVAAAVVLWPTTTPTARIAAAGALGERRARGAWAAGWVAMALLCVLGSARSPWGISRSIGAAASGQPGWLHAIDHAVAAAVGANGLAVALGLCVLCLVVAAGVYLPAPLARATLVVAIVLSLAMWVVTQGFGQILSGGATDPDSGPLLVLLALSYWPMGPARAVAPATAVEAVEPARSALAGATR